jgi:hypothetical protein
LRRDNEDETPASIRMKKCRCWRDVELRLVVGGLIAWEKNRQLHSVKLGILSH